MKSTLILLTALLLAPLAAHAKQTVSPTTTVRDHLWLFGYPTDGDAEYLENAATAVAHA